MYPLIEVLPGVYMRADVVFAVGQAVGHDNIVEVGYFDMDGGSRIAATFTRSADAAEWVDAVVDELNGLLS